MTSTRAFLDSLPADLWRKIVTDAAPKQDLSEIKLALDSLARASAATSLVNEHIMGDGLEEDCERVCAVLESLQDFKNFVDLRLKDEAACEQPIFTYWEDEFEAVAVAMKLNLSDAKAHVEEQLAIHFSLQPHYELALDPPLQFFPRE